MAETRGLVQLLKVSADGVTIALVGPNRTNVTALIVQRVAADTREQASVKDDIVNAMAAAMVANREVVAFHGDADSIVRSLRIEPV